jgi:hypothetical protein
MAKTPPKKDERTPLYRADFKALAKVNSQADEAQRRAVERTRALDHQAAAEPT